MFWAEREPKHRITVYNNSNIVAATKIKHTTFSHYLKCDCFPFYFSVCVHFADLTVNFWCVFSHIRWLFDAHFGWLLYQVEWLLLLYIHFFRVAIRNWHAYQVNLEISFLLPRHCSVMLMIPSSDPKSWIKSSLSFDAFALARDTDYWKCDMISTVFNGSFRKRMFKLLKLSDY